MQQKRHLDEMFCSRKKNFKSLPNLKKRFQLTCADTIFRTVSGNFFEINGSSNFWW